MRSFKLLVLSVMILVCFSCNPDQPIQIAVVTGGHAYDSVNFVEVFKSYPDVKFDHLIHPDANDIYLSDSLDKYDAIVFYDLYQEISEEQKTAFLKMLEEGKGLVFLHHSIASYQDWDEQPAILGAKYFLEPGVLNEDSVPASTYYHDEVVDVQILDSKHPVTTGLEDFTIGEETYDLVYISPDIHPLIGTDHPDSMDEVVWTNKYGKSRIVYIQFGHDNNAFSNPNFRQLLYQAIDWTSK